MDRIEIITIGDELVEGRLVDTNAHDMSERLAAEGLRVARHLSVGDIREEIVAALREAAARSRAVLVSGGLGPTTDDLTAECAAAAFGRSVARSPEALAHVQEFFARRGRSMTTNNEKQADLPEGSVILPNPVGTAVGFAMSEGDCSLYFMPGVPSELLQMLEASVLPDLRSKLASRPVSVATLKSFGKGESEVGHLLSGLGDGLVEPGRLNIQYRATFPEIHVRLVLEEAEHEADQKLLGLLVEEARQRLGPAVFAVGGARLDTSFAEAVVADLEAVGATVAVVEGATAGAVGNLLGSVPRYREVLCSSELLGDDAARDGCGDDRCAAVEALASSARDSKAASYGLAVDGCPDGAAEQAGVIWVGLASLEGCSSRSIRFPVDRERWRQLAAHVALALLRRAVSEPAGSA